MFIPIGFLQVDMTHVYSHFLYILSCGKEFNTTALANLHIYNVYVKHYTVMKFNNSKEISKVDTK